MIGIKGMQMPKNSKTCRFRHSIFDYCVIDKDRNTIKTDNNDKCLNCPLVDLGSEDMSWEELKEKCKQIKDTENIIFTFEVNEEVLIVKKLNRYFRQNTTDLTPFQIWQIINALTGDNKCQKQLKQKKDKENTIKIIEKNIREIKRIKKIKKKN